MKSIMQTEKGVCFLTGKRGYTEEHHIFYGGGRRKLSERYGLKVYLSPELHRNGPEAVHNCKATRRKLEAAGQQAFELKGGTRKEFMDVFGKNYL